jgi:hypothetical protein
LNKTAKTSYKFSLYPCVLLLSVILSSYSAAQITIPQSGFTNLLTVGASVYNYNADAAPRQLNIGRRGGPNIYDFTGYSYEQTKLSHVYSIGAIPMLAARYSSKAIVLGATAESMDNEPVFLFSTDTLFVLGQASLVPQRRFLHIRPYEPMAVFPVTYQSSRTYSHTHYDTTYNASGSVAATNVYSGSDSVTVDGYGTLKILGREFECLRVKMNHYTFSDKEFVYLTREGLLLDIMMASSQLDTGFVQPTGVVLFVPSSLVTVDKEVLVPSDYALEQNYPNPFNPTTTISFSLPSKTFVTLKIFDALGREVSVVLGEELSPGTYSRQWNSANAPSGVYFYRLQAGQYTETKKMLLLR